MASNCASAVRPLVLQVSTHDNLIPAAMQFKLADKLRARTVTIPTGTAGPSGSHGCLLTGSQVFRRPSGLHSQSVTVIGVTALGEQRLHTNPTPWLPVVSRHATAALTVGANHL